MKLNVAQNWITLTIYHEGDWGGFDTAQVTEQQDFTRGPRLLGYYFRVDPAGFIVVSVRKELAAVKAYSSLSWIDPASDTNLSDLIKGGLERMLDAVEQRLGPIGLVEPQDLDAILEINYTPSWDELGGDPDAFLQLLAAGGIRSNYQSGTAMLTSHWHQLPPYNDDCPNMGCSWPDYGYYNQNAVVGCVATAGSQIMRYWNWPPYGVGSPYDDTYDWPKMLNMYVWDSGQSRFEDENGTEVTQAQIDAVAELCSEVGIAVSMDYGCGGSSANTYDMEEDVYEGHYRYSTACARVNRVDYTTPDAWFAVIQGQCNMNRPMHYRIKYSDRRPLHRSGWMAGTRLARPHYQAIPHQLRMGQGRQLH